MPLEMRCRTHLLRKTRNKFFEISDFRKNNRVFLAANDRKELKTSSKKGFQIKNHSVSESAELGLSSHAFISISNFLTKIDFFEGGGVALIIFFNVIQCYHKHVLWL